MAKILITSLGAGKREDGGKYKIAKYKINNEVESESLILKALDKQMKFDKMFIIGTKKSMWDNLYEEYEGDDEDYQIQLLDKMEKNNLIKDDLSLLKKQMENSKSANKIINDSKSTSGKKQNTQKNEVHFFLVDYGLDRDEIWKNFKIFLEISDQIKSGDEVHLDITHSFRSLSLMSYIMLDFIKSVKNTDFTVKSIYYGMFEYQNESENIEKITPVVDLKILFEFNEWIKAISAFKNFGRADLIKTALEDSIGKNNILTKFFNKFSNNISMANLASIKSQINEVQSQIQLLVSSKHPMLEFITKDITDFFNRMNTDKMSDFQFELSCWFTENKNYSMAYLSLVESIVTKICELELIDIYNKTTRETAKDLLFNNDKYEDYKTRYKKINDIRKSIAHQDPERKIDLEESIKNLKKTNK